MGIVLIALYKMRPKYSHFQGMNLHILNGSSGVKTLVKSLHYKHIRHCNALNGFINNSTHNYLTHETCCYLNVRHNHEYVIIVMH